MKNILTVLSAIILTLSLTAQEKAYTPVLVTPEDAAINLMPITTLDWNPVAGFYNIRYEIQVSNNESFTDIAAELVAICSAVETPALKFNSQYYWKVRAVDDNNTSEWSEVRTFTTFEALTTTAPNSNNVQSPRTTFSWKSVGNITFNGIASFEVLVDTSKEFDPSSPNYRQEVFEGDFTGSVSTSQYIPDLVFGNKYYWKVRAINSGIGVLADESAWTTVDSFNIVSANVPTSPSNGEEDVDPNIELKVKNTYNPCSYIFQISEDEEFTAPAQYSSKTTTLKEYDTLEYGKTYYWRNLLAYNGQQSDWTEVWSFSVIAAPTLVGPANGADMTKDDGLRFKKIGGTDEYEIQVAANNTFTNPVTYTMSQPSATVGSALLSNFHLSEYNMTYYWRVKASNKASGESDWSVVRSFVYRESSGINDYDKVSTTIYPNPNNGKFSIELNQRVDNAQIRIFDLTGRVHFIENISLNENEKYDISVDLQNGLYILEMNNNGIRTHKKFTVM